MIFSRPSYSFQTWTVSILPPLHRFKGLIKGKVPPRCGRKRTLSDFITFFYLLVLVCCITCVFAFILSQTSFYALLCLTYFCLFIFSFSLFCFLYKNFLKKFEKTEKYKNSVCYVYIGTCVPWMAIETKFSKLCIVCSLDEHLYAQLSKWALWLLFVMSKIKLSLILNTHITLFDGND